MMDGYDIVAEMTGAIDQEKKENYAQQSGLSTSKQQHITAAAEKQTGDVVGENNGGLKNIQRGYFDLASMMPQFNLSNDSGEYRYIVNSSETSVFNAVAEGSDASESAVAFTEKSAKPENIRSYFLASREIADDVANFESFVTQRGYQMLIDQQNGQILLGNGTSPNLSGLLLSANRTAFDYTNGKFVVNSLLNK